MPEQAFGCGPQLRALGNFRRYCFFGLYFGLGRIVGLLLEFNSTHRCGFRQISIHTRSEAMETGQAVNSVPVIMQNVVGACSSDSIDAGGASLETAWRQIAWVSIEANS